MPEKKQRSILILYHFYTPDDVISARHFSDLAEGLAQRGWDTTVYTSNRYCRNTSDTITPKRETINNVKIIRFSRLGLNQSKNISRMINSLTISLKWLLSILLSRHYDVILIGTDPQFGYFITPFIKLFKPKTHLATWAFDLYPEIIGHMGKGKLFTSIIVSLLRPWARLSYKSMDFIADLGCCMRERIATYKPKARCCTLIPWAISEPGEILQPEPEIRRKLFGEAKLAILYSGTIGKAHQFEEFIELARILRSRNASVSFCFAGRGNQYQQLRAMVTESDSNISFAGFADEHELELRLSAADIHLLSLRNGWEGLVVPSKFFGSLAAGRPLIYAGCHNSAIRHWIEQFNIGYVLDSSSTSKVADTLVELTKDSTKLQEIQLKTFQTWQEHFSREKVLDSFNIELLRIINER